MTEQPRTISTTRIARRRGTVGAAAMRGVDQSLSDFTASVTALAATDLGHRHDETPRDQYVAVVTALDVGARHHLAAQ